MLAALALGVIGVTPLDAVAAEARTYEVRLQGRTVGEAMLAVREEAGGVVTYVHHSRLTAGREGTQAERVFHEEVRLRHGVFEAAWAWRDQDGERRVVRAAWEPAGAVVRVERDGRVERVPAGDPAGLETLFDAPRRLVRTGAVGARRRVFDLPDGKVGEVVLVSAPDAEGWAETLELGVRVRTRWSAGARLPDALELPEAGMVYRARGVTLGARAAAPEQTAAGVAVAGTLKPGGRARLRPRSFWAGLGCPEVVALGPAGPACGTEGGGSAGAAQAGPGVRALAATIPAGDAMARAGALARAVAARLDPRAGGAALWEADAEAALAAGAGDCNEAAAVFAAAARQLDLRVRRRTGLVLDPDAPGRLWPHAWVEVHDGKRWVRVDPSRGQAPAEGVYLDLGDGETSGDRLRAVSAALKGARVEALD